MFQLSPRQVHLDFHTSELIPDIGKDFNPEEFAKTARDANVSSITVFARCHHGMLYYPSQKFPELIHPNLNKKNLLLEQVRALHKHGIKAPIYITVQWDYYHARTKPEWLIRKADGSHEGDAFFKPGFYQSLCVNTGYIDFLKAQTTEICEMLGEELDGVFFDIVGIRPCLCASCRAEMKKLGLDISSELAVRKFAKMVIDRFKTDMTLTVREINKNCTIFYNAGHVGPCTKNSADHYTHFELESLPSGGWGYLHFPVTARYARNLGLDCIGMTGKFHTSWGDFHSLKNLAALEFECLRMLSYGFACSIGDQLEPTGQLNPATYKLIGKVYKQFQECEQWARPSMPVVEIAVVTAENPLFEGDMPEQILGAAQMLEELAIQFDIIDTEMPLDKYKLIILPDGLIVDDSFQTKIDMYTMVGGKVIACADGGLSDIDFYPNCFGVQYVGMAKKYPDFLVAKGLLSGGLEEDNEYVIYKQGVEVKPNDSTPIMTARAPYFSREKDAFCSHSYTPSAKGLEYPAVFKNDNIILFTHPIFAQYRENAPNWCKQLIANAIELLLPTRILRHNGPSTLVSSVLYQPERNGYTVFLLSYIPVRKSATIDIIEERTILDNITLEFNLPKEITKAKLMPEDIELEVKDRKVTIPRIDGYTLLLLE